VQRRQLHLLVLFSYSMLRRRTEIAKSHPVVLRRSLRCIGLTQAVESSSANRRPGFFSFRCRPKSLASTYHDSFDCFVTRAPCINSPRRGAAFLMGSLAEACSAVATGIIVGGPTKLPFAGIPAHSGRPPNPFLNAIVVALPIRCLSLSLLPFGSLHYFGESRACFPLSSSPFATTLDFYILDVDGQPRPLGVPLSRCTSWRPAFAPGFSITTSLNDASWFVPEPLSFASWLRSCTMTVLHFAALVARRGANSLICTFSLPSLALRPNPAPSKHTCPHLFAHPPSPGYRPCIEAALFSRAPSPPSFPLPSHSVNNLRYIERVLASKEPAPPPAYLSGSSQRALSRPLVDRFATSGLQAAVLSLR